MSKKEQTETNNKIRNSLASAASRLARASKSPDEVLGDLFIDVQNSNIYNDGKAFTDLVPRHRATQIKQEYLLAKQDPNFDLRDFVSRHFYVLYDTPSSYKTDTRMSPTQHIDKLWSVLERNSNVNQGSLIALPRPYIVPGGRFSEQFYWDSYFIMVGLASSGKWDMVENMLKNFAFMIRKFGFIPTANRTYFLSRSQPPLFSKMVELLASHRGQSVLVEYLPYLVLEYRFWMKGRRKLSKSENRAFARVVEMPSGSLLNRYYDNKNTPRPESYREDTLAASEARQRQADRLYLHLRAGAESGWDFSSRWFRDSNDIKSIYTADIIPVDLNSLLYSLELTIAKAYRLAKQPMFTRSFEAMADRRARAINQYCWSTENKFFNDYNFHRNTKTGKLSLAGVFPLYVKIATEEQAGLVAKRIERDFLKKGGLISTLVETGQQWDSPNGWAPLHWIVVEALRNYGYYDLANEIKNRWVRTNLKLFKKDGRLVEKYNVVDTNLLGGGGEYPLQDGFGWTNGVLAAFLAEEKTNL